MVDDACENLYADDKDIQGLMKEMNDVIEAAFEGRSPLTTCQIPEFLTPDRTLLILEARYKECRKVAFLKMEALRK